MQRINTKRRQFLKSSACAASAIALPNFVARRALGLAGSPGANERIVLGIIGCGTRGDQLSDNIPAGAAVAAVADCDKDRKLLFSYSPELTMKDRKLLFSIALQASKG